MLNDEPRFFRSDLPQQLVEKNRIKALVFPAVTGRKALDILRAMLAVEAAAFPPMLAVLALLTAMFVKATLIAGWFMHLRFERISLTLSLVLGTLLTAAFLYFLIVPDGIRMLELAP
jgi:hypothetical protein